MSNLEKLKNIFTDLFGDEIDLDSINENSKFAEDLSMNSIAMLSMAIAIENEFNIKFDNDDFKTLKTVKDLLSKIEN